MVVQFTPSPMLKAMDYRLTHLFYVKRFQIRDETMALQRGCAERIVRKHAASIEKHIIDECSCADEPDGTCWYRLTDEQKQREVCSSIVDAVLLEIEA